LHSLPPLSLRDLEQRVRQVKAEVEVAIFDRLLAVGADKGRSAVMPAILLHPLSMLAFG
jgi:hypothetical protein